ncbi:unnamed protein product [Lupinus luteus]|uniref:Mei2-like C-terminal RNA recognition motif domain-containing protein n=1 Tax=Lupinus luteus TaxID=3873 RepID=A0AAV1Y2Z0_LUPLU
MSIDKYYNKKCDGNMSLRGSVGVAVGLPGNMTEISSPNFRMVSLPLHGSLFLGNGRSKRPDNSGNHIDSKKQYQLDLLWLRYTSSLLLAAIDENHKGSYDFLYLSIDIKVSTSFTSAW